MAFCPKCGNFNEDGATFCASCGTPLASVQSVPPYPTGGLMAWAIISLLFCTIPGIVAIVKVSGINKAVSVSDQQQRISSAKTWCTIATVLGIIAVIVSVLAQNA